MSVLTESSTETAFEDELAAFCQPSPIVFADQDIFDVKALQGPGMLDTSVVPWMQGFSEYKLVRWLRQGRKPKLDRRREETMDSQEVDVDKTKVQLQLLPDTYSWGHAAYNICTQTEWVME